MNIENIIKNQDILDCWKEIQKSNIDKNIGYLSNSVDKKV